VYTGRPSCRRVAFSEAEEEEEEEEEEGSRVYIV